MCIIELSLNVIIEKNIKISWRSLNRKKDTKSKRSLGEVIRI